MTRAALGCFMGFALGCALSALYTWASEPLPLVYADSLSHKCVRAEGPRGLIPCDTLPKKYHLIFVAPSVHL